MTDANTFEIERLTYKIKAWTFQSKQTWNPPAQKALFRSWIKEAKAKIASLKAA